MPCQCEFFIPGQSGRIDGTSLDAYDGPELEGYVGPFYFGQNTNENARKFSKKTLAGIIEAAGRLEAAHTGLYMTAVAARLGEDVAYELDREQSRWSVAVDMANVRKAFAVPGDDVEAFFKCCQCMPVRMATMPDVEFDLPQSKLGTMTVKQCRPLNYCKRFGRTQLQEHLCKTICVEGFQTGANFINPAIKVTPLKLPRRQRNGWEIWKEEGVTDEEHARALVKELMAETDWPALGPVACKWEFRIE
jgi:hypothetical protein